MIFCTGVWIRAQGAFFCMARFFSQRRSVCRERLFCAEAKDSSLRGAWLHYSTIRVIRFLRDPSPSTSRLRQDQSYENSGLAKVSKTR